MSKRSSGYTGFDSGLLSEMEKVAKTVRSRSANDGAYDDLKRRLGRERVSFNKEQTTTRPLGWAGKKR